MNLQTAEAAFGYPFELSLMSRKILFTDEPTGNLDSPTSRSWKTCYFDYQKRLKATLIIVTHDEELATFTVKPMVWIKRRQNYGIDSGDSPRKRQLRLKELKK